MIPNSQSRWVSGVALGAIVCFSVATSPSMAWSGFAHYQATPAGLAWKVNLPDIADSKTSLGSLSYEVSDWFGWGHDCQRTGVYTIAWGAFVEPNTPTSYGVPTGVEFAEWDMYALRLKMTPAHRQRENDYLMLTTAQGWLAHNQMDSVVHFTYFLGGSTDNWITQHAAKETWADLVLFAAATGYPPNPWGGYIHGMRASGHGGIICLAQKCYRKNRRTVDAVPPYSGTFAPGPVETRAQNDGRIVAQDASLSGATYTEDDYNYYMSKAGEQGWSTAAMLSLHATAAARAAAAVGAMP